MNITRSSAQRIILGCGLVVAVSTYFLIAWSELFIPLQLIKLEEAYAFLAFGFLYLTLFQGAFYGVFPKSKGRELTSTFRGGLGILTVVFAAIHGYISFFYLFEGFSGWPFLSWEFQTAMLMGIVSFFILALVALASIPFVKKVLHNYWTVLMKLVYLAGLLLIIHPIVLGSHFHDPTVFSVLFIGAVFLILILQSIRFRRYLSHQFPTLPRSVVIVVVAALLIFFGIIIFGAHSFVHGS